MIDEVQCLVNHTFRSSGSQFAKSYAINVTIELVAGILFSRVKLIFLGEHNPWAVLLQNQRNELPIEWREIDGP